MVGAIGGARLDLAAVLQSLAHRLSERRI